MVLQYPLRGPARRARNGRIGPALLIDNLLRQLQVQMQIEAHFVSDVLRGDDTTEMRVSLVRYIEDEMPPEEE